MNEFYKNYHIVDDRWPSVFGINDFDTYCRLNLVQGRFHSIVPKDVVEAFTMVEYMMAHAWYHYPLYYEALSKVLRIIEMAVKLRCTQLNIDLEFNTVKGRKKKTLKKLMDEITTAESEKELAFTFEIIRELRNSMMHPTHHTYSGSMPRLFIMRSVTLLNKLFLPESVFQSAWTQLNKMQEDINQFHQRPFVLNYENKKYLVEKISVEAAVKINNQWIYLLVAIPLPSNPFESLTSKFSLDIFSFHIQEITITENKLTAVEYQSEKQVVAEITSHPHNLKVYKEYQHALTTIDVKTFKIYEDDLSLQIGQSENNFLYVHVIQYSFLKTSHIKKT